MLAVSKAVSLLSAPIRPSTYFGLQTSFYLLSFAYYIERQWNFDFYYSPILVGEFHSDLVQGLAVSPFFPSISVGLKVLHAVFLAALLAAAFNRKRRWLNVFLYGFNFLLLILNYSSGYAADIFIQLGLFFYIFGSLGSSKLERSPDVLVSLLLLRLYLGAGYLFSVAHKIADFQRTGSTFLESFALLQQRNLVAEGLVLGENILSQFRWELFGLVLATQFLGGLFLMSRRTSRTGLVILVVFHLISMPLLNLILFPLISITLLSLSCVSENFSAREIFDKLKAEPT
jgi:hypothetical protein